MADNFDKNLLVGKKTIMSYLDLSEDLYDKFRNPNEGIKIKDKRYIMPILIVDRRHYATKFKLDEFWNYVCSFTSFDE